MPFLYPPDLALPPSTPGPSVGRACSAETFDEHAGILPAAAGGKEPVRLDLTAGVLAVSPECVGDGAGRLLRAGFRHDEPTGRLVAPWSPEREDVARQVAGAEPHRVALAPLEIARSRVEHLRQLADQAEEQSRRRARKGREVDTARDPEDFEGHLRALDLAAEAGRFECRVWELRQRARDVPLEVAAAWEPMAIEARLRVLERRVRQVRFPVGRRSRRVRAFLRQRIERELQLLERAPHHVPRWIEQRQHRRTRVPAVGRPATGTASPRSAA